MYRSHHRWSFGLKIAKVTGMSIRATLYQELRFWCEAELTLRWETFVVRLSRQWCRQIWQLYFDAAYPEVHYEAEELEPDETVEPEFTTEVIELWLQHRRQRANEDSEENPTVATEDPAEREEIERHYAEEYFIPRGDEDWLW